MIEHLPPPERRAAHELLARLKHDLGKYVVFQQRWLGDDPDPLELLTALRADLLATRRGPEGQSTAVEVWQAARPTLVGERTLDGVRVDLRRDPDFELLHDQIRALSDCMEELRADVPSPACIQQCQELSWQIAQLCRRLERRARSQET